jgi:nucleoside-diphosphate-sugar epimerase
VVDAAIDAFAGTGNPYIHISGLWIYGNNPSVSEESPLNPPALVAWKEPIERRLLSEKEMRGVVIVSSTAYGDGGGGTPGILLGSPRDDSGNLIMLGTGQQHWSTVRVADLADFFVRVLEDDSAHGRFVIGAEVLLLDQGTGAAKARAELDWQPTHPSLVEEFRNGSYRASTTT